MRTGIEAYNGSVSAIIISIFDIHDDSDEDFWDIIDLWIRRGMRHAEEERA